MEKVIVGSLVAIVQFGELEVDREAVDVSFWNRRIRLVDWLQTKELARFVRVTMLT